MVLFLVIFIFLFFFSFIKKQNNNNVFYFSVVVLLVLYSIRSLNVGTDTMQYSYIFEDIKSGSRTYIDYLWYILNKFVVIIGGNYRTLMFLSGILTIVPLAYVLKKECENSMMGLFFYFSLYFYGVSFNISRQVLAISIILLGYLFLVRRNNLKFFICIVLASLFHPGSILALIAYPLNKIKLADVEMILIQSISLIFGSVVINKTLLILFGAGYGEHYANHPTEGFRDSFVYPFIITIFVNIYFIIIQYFSKDEIKESLWNKLFFIYIIINNLTFKLVLGSRLFLYFSIAQIIFFVLFINNNKIKPKIFASLLVITFAVLMFLKMYLTNAAEIFPYSIM